MKKFSYLLILLVLWSCKKENQDNHTEYLSKLIITVTNDNGNLVLKDTYTFNENAQVLKDSLTRYPGTSSFSTVYEFIYNNDGQIIEEKKDGITFKTVNWQQQTATVNYSSGGLPYEAVFQNNRLTEIHYPPVNGQPYNFYYHYDTNGNLTEIVINQSVVNMTFLNYDTSTENPYYLLRSIVFLGHIGSYSPNLYASYIVGDDPYVCTGDMPDPDISYIFDSCGKLIETIRRYPSGFGPTLHTKFEYFYQ